MLRKQLPRLCWALMELSARKVDFSSYFICCHVCLIGFVFVFVKVNWRNHLKIITLIDWQGKWEKCILEASEAMAWGLLLIICRCFDVEFEKYHWFYSRCNFTAFVGTGLKFDLQYVPHWCIKGFIALLQSPFSRLIVKYLKSPSRDKSILSWHFVVCVRGGSYPLNLGY